MNETAERLARHLETNYGLQLDDYRRRALVEEIGIFLAEPQAVEVPTEEAAPPDLPKPRKQKTSKEKR